MRLIETSTWLAFAGAGLYLLGPAALLAAPQERSDARPPTLSRRVHSTKPTWHSGPASTPPQTELVLPPREAPPPAKSALLTGQAEAKTPAVMEPSAVTHAGSGFLTRHPSAAAHEPASTADIIRHNDSNVSDPEAQRIRDELNRLRNDAGARRAFYDELRRTVERVRAGLPDEDSQNPASPRPAASQSPDTSGEPPNPPAADELDQSPSANAETPEASLGTHRGSLPDRPSPLPPGGEGPYLQHLLPPLPLGGEGPGVRGSRFASATVDRAAYRRVVRCAKANGAPVPLALGVAWMESHLQTYPPRGAAGEVGMFQILPARCRIEGWPPKRLEEPEFNAWLGTRLLARYYQEEGSWARAAAKYVAGPGVFDRSYSQDLWAYINWYANSVDSYAGYFSRYQT